MKTYYLFDKTGKVILRTHVARRATIHMKDPDYGMLATDQKLIEYVPDYKSNPVGDWLDTVWTCPGLPVFNENLEITGSAPALAFAAFVHRL